MLKSSMLKSSMRESAMRAPPPAVRSFHAALDAGGERAQREAGAALHRAERHAEQRRDLAFLELRAGDAKRQDLPMQRPELGEAALNATLGLRELGQLLRARRRRLGFRRHDFAFAIGSGPRKHGA